MDSTLEQLESRAGVTAFAFRGDIYLHGATDALTEGDRAWLRAGKERFLAELGRRPLLFALNPFQRSMVIGELVTGNVVANSMFYLLTRYADVAAAAMRSALAQLAWRHPLLGARVVLRDEQFCFEIREDPGEDAMIHVDQEDCATDANLGQRYLFRPRSVLEQGLFQAVCARVAGRPRWGVWLHHVLADAQAVDGLLADLGRALDGEALDPAPDFTFLQQDWEYQRSLNITRPADEAFWRRFEQGRRGPRLTAADLPLGPDVCVHRWDLPRPLALRLHAATQRHQISTLALFAAALRDAVGTSWSGRDLLVLTTLSLRNLEVSPAGTGFFVNLVPFVLPAARLAGNAEDPGGVRSLDHHLRSVLEHAALPLEETLAMSGVDRAELNVLINVVDQRLARSLDIASHASERKVRRPLTLTVFLRPGGEITVALSTRLPGALTSTLGQAIARALERLAAALGPSSEERAS
jgi:hypothetical protein